VFDPTSRYAALEDAALIVDGRIVRYKRRRFIPQPGGSTVLEYQVAPGDRLDLLAARFFNDALQYWRLCDAAGVLDPEDLEQPGVTVQVRLEVPL
jgi:hypothetical protein